VQQFYQINFKSEEISIKILGLFFFSENVLMQRQLLMLCSYGLVSYLWKGAWYTNEIP